MVPLKLFFAGYPRERISSGSGVPKAGFEPARVSPPPPQNGVTCLRRETEFFLSKAEENTYEEIHASLLGIMLGGILE
jgi:hypothetical protein